MSPPWERHAQLLSSIQKEWDLAEADIKQAEQVCHSVVVPAIKELRYAGRRLVEAIQPTISAPDRVQALLQDANFNCHRARHDAIDAGTSKIASDLDIMVSKIGHDAILKCYPDFAVMRHELSEIRAVIVESRGNREGRAAFYVNLENAQFPAIVKRHVTLQAAEPMMREMASASRRAKFYSWIFGFGGLAFGVIGFGFAIYAWEYPR